MGVNQLEKIVLITGSSRGIGAATARLLGKENFAVCVNFKSNQSAANSIVDEIKACGTNAIAVQADVSREEEVNRLFSTIDDELGAITCLVNNAGILLPQMRVEKMTEQRINKMLTTNVTSYFLCCREAIKRMSTEKGGKGGSIVNVSSAASRLGAPGEYVDYAASKGAIDTLTRGLALEVAREGIRVNCVRPGFIYTEMHSDGGEPGRIDRIKTDIPLGRGGKPEEIAAAISWLLSDDASYATGTFIDVAGGR